AALTGSGGTAGAPGVVTPGAHAPSTADAVASMSAASRSATCACICPYDPAPASPVTSISPVNGTSAGGTAVTITGTDFQAGASATIGGVALSTQSVTATAITGTTAPHAPNATNTVVVANPDTQSGTCP